LESSRRDDRTRPAGADDPTVARRRRGLGQDELVALVGAARGGDEQAWTQLVTHFSVPIQSVARRHRLSPADQEDVVQDTWLRLVERINTLREPAALPGWLVTTARHESLDVIQGASRERPSDGERELANRSTGEDVHEELVTRERRAALRRAIADLPNRQKALLQLMITQPALSYDQVSEQLGLPIGSIGPTRGRSLARLRRDPHLSAWAQEDDR
jgi:RNA polymerase sigma factor (sigma-70 family)